MDTIRNFRIQLASHFSLTEIEGKLVLFSKQTGDFFGLNETALVLLKYFLEKDFEKTVEFGAHEFQVEEDRIKNDILELIAELEKHKVLKRVLI